MKLAMAAWSEDPQERERRARLERASVAELEGLRERIERELTRRGQERDRGLRERGGLVEASGPQYRNPENSAETWSGRGQKPTWVREALARGVILSELEISDNRPEPIDPNRRPI